MNPSKRKGTAAESAVVAYANTHGAPYAERRALAGAADKGDVSGIPGVCLEVKNCQRIEIPKWLDEVTVEAVNANAEIPVVIHKRRGTTDVGEWPATMKTSVLFRLLRQAGWLDTKENA